MAGVLDLPTLVQKVRMEANTSDAEREVQGSMTRIGSSMMKVGAGMTAGLTVPIVGLVASGVKAASDLAESSSKVGVVFEGNADRVKAFASTAAEQLGMSEQAALEAAGTFGNLFRALGVGTEPAAEMSTNLVQLAADLASFNNVNPEDALIALRAGLLGEAEPLRKFGVSLSQARIESEALSSGLVKGTGDATKITDATLKFEAAQKKLAEAQHGTPDPAKAAAAEKALASARDAASKSSIDIAAAERAVNEARAKNGPGSTQVKAAEDRLAKARLGGDAAARKVTEAQAKLDAARSGGKADADELAKLTNDVAKAEEAMGKATAGTVPELTAAQKAQAAYSIIQKDTALAQGDFERTSGGLANQQRILAAQFVDAKAGLGQVFLPLVLKVTTGVNKLLGEFKGLSPEMKKWVGIVAGVAAAAGPLLIVGGKLAKSFEAIKSVIGGGSFLLGLGPLLPVVLAVAAAGFVIFKNWDKIKPVLEKVADQARYLFDVFKNAMKAGDAFGLTGKDGLEGKVAVAGKAVGDFVGKARLLFAAFKVGLKGGDSFFGAKGFAGDAVKAGKIVADVLGKVVDFVKTYWKPIVIGAFIAFAGPVLATAALLVVLWKRFEVVRTVVSTVVRFFLDTFVPTLVKVGQVVARWVGNVVDFFREIAPQVKEAFGHIVNVIQFVFAAIWDVVQTALGVLAALWRAWGDDIWNIVKAIFRTLGEVIRGALEVVKGIIKTVLAVINGDWGAAWDGLKGIVDGVWDAIFGVLRGAKDIIESIFGGIASTVSEVWRGVWDGIKSTASDGWKNLVKFVLNPMIEGFNKAIDGLNLVNPFADIPHIPTITVATETKGGGEGPRGMALGGSFNPGDFTLTGERGPELQMRRFPGSVLSANRLEGLLQEMVSTGGGGGGGVTFAPTIHTVDRPSGERLGRDMAWGLVQAQGRPMPSRTGG